MRDDKAKATSLVDPIDGMQRKGRRDVIENGLVRVLKQVQHT